MLFLASLTIGIISFGVLYIIDEYSLLYYGDAISHLISARIIIDTDSPCIQIGTVWLPIPHIMFLPFSSVDSLYSTGIAGLLVNLPLHALTTVLIFKIANTQTNKKWISVIIALVYASNPNLIYLGITTMTEAPFLFFFVASAYFLQKWNSTNQVNLKEGLASAAFIALATLSRYEAWILAPAFILFAIYFVSKNKSQNHKILIIIISLIAFSGIIFWTGWNEVSYGNPLEFATSQFYSASSQASERPHKDFLYFQPQNVAYMYGLASVMVLGPILLLMSASGHIIKIKNKMKNSFLLFYLSLPVLFTLFTLFIGIGEMSEWWFNARFTLFLIPLVLILSTITLSEISKKTRRKIILGVVVIGMFAFQLLTPTQSGTAFVTPTDKFTTFGVATYIDAYEGWVYQQTPYAVKTSEFLKDNYDDGNIMMITGSGQAAKIMVLSGLNLTTFDQIINYDAKSECDKKNKQISFEEPWKHDKWIILGIEPDSDSENAAKYWENNMNELLKYYDMEYENKFYSVFKLK